MQKACPHLQLLHTVAHRNAAQAGWRCAASASRPFTSSASRPSHIGSAPLTIPPNVELTVLQPTTSSNGVSSRSAPLPKVHIKGPLGELSMDIPTYLNVVYDEASRRATVSILDAKERKQRAMWGTSRAYLANHLLGVSEGHTCLLRLVGVGYRATVESSAVTKKPEYPGQKFVSLKVGYSHPIELGVPLGVKASTPQPTRILLEGIEKEVVKQFAGEIRMWRKPEPYKGKGIFVDDETIKLKAKKIK